ncbi:uncharacterized protein isoform X2 [Choristoneura fumiferana]|uniref:uncharacterized protein isoform X2 n=1 Tax=Choristoneura fumiferana TaxID=7141 RepID=UPI003D15B759
MKQEKGRWPCELELLCDPPDEQYADREMFESQYYRLVASARNLLPAGADKDGSPGSPSRSGSVASYDNDKSGGTCEHTKRFNLPKINIPIFNGSYQHWLEFRDIFTSMIHSNRELDNISKFHYLRASLQGNAAMIVKNIDFTNNNYTIAWNLLCDRYNNSRLLVNNHVQALFNVESVSKESSRSLRYLIDVTNKNIRALTTLNQPTEHWDTLIIHMMSTKLDPITNLKWEEHRNTGSDAPTLADFCTFLRNRADLLETLEENKAKNSKFDHPKSKSFIVVSDSQKSQQNNFSSGKYSKTNKCPLCKDEHTLYNCNAFRDLSIEDRVVKAKQFNVCLNCLRTGHSQNKCQSPHCRYCRYKHNTLLHLEKRDSSSNDYNSVPIQENVALPVDNQTYYEPPTDNVTLSTNITQQTTAPQILLSTAMVKVYDSNGNKHTARLLLDNGSTANFISHELCVKAVHLELVTDLTKEAYIAALQRFISRRGKPLTITSDHGTNFVGACNELTSVINKSNLASDLADEGIKFLFTPAYSPHFNGLAESAVRSTKFHLKRILNLTHLTYEEMSTCLTQIEAILNSRPLTPLSTDPTDMSALTPAHFLIGRSLTSVPCPQIADDVNINLLQRHKRIDVIKQHFWRRFANDYVFTLQQKSKWLTSSSPSLKVDSLVLVKDKVNPPLMWCLGRVTRLYPGPDGINRVADVKTRRGTLRRGWNNLCPLPMDQDL